MKFKRYIVGVNKMNAQSIVEIMENNKKIYEILKHCPYEILRQWQLSKYPKGYINSHTLNIRNIATGAVRNDGASDAYIKRGYPAIPDTELLFHMIETAKQLGYTYHYGKVRSHDSFYTDAEQEIDNYWSKKGILAADMETSALFVIGGLRNVKVASILNVVVEAEGSLEGGSMIM